MAANRDTILQNIVTVLRAIDGTGSYKTAIKTVERIPQAVVELPQAALPHIAVRDGPEDYQHLENFGRMRVTLKVYLHCILKDVSVTTVDTKLSNLIDDIIYALHLDPRRGTTGGLANATTTLIRRTTPEDYTPDNRTLSCTFEFDVIYHRTAGAS